MEKEFFKWEDWDQIDTLVLGFNNCTILKEIGIFQPGMHVDYITMDYSEGRISIYSEDLDTEYSYQLNLSIGDEIARD